MGQKKRRFTNKEAMSSIVMPTDPDALRADLERRRSNAARPPLSRSVRRQTSRADRKRAEIRDAS